MAGRQAKIITPTLLRRMLAQARKGPYPKRDCVIILLSVKAGLRACEIARLDWSMALDAQGQIGSLLNVRDAIAKMGSGRRIPMHPDLRNAIARLKGRAEPNGSIVRSARGGAMRPNSIVNWFVTLFAELDARGCSSHSGRRTFITTAARRAHHAGCSIRDVQLLAGHSSIELTQRYIDGDTHGQRRLVRML